MKYLLMAFVILLIFAGCDDGSTTPTKCTENEIRHIACGEDNLGEQKQICTNGKWTNSGECSTSTSDIDIYVDSENDDNDEITDLNTPTTDEDATTNCDTENEIKYFTCGLNDKGTQPYKCTNGDWVLNGTCNDPDVCKNNATQNVSCGFNDNGTQAQTCTNGQWVNNGNCNESDICTNNATRNTSCGLNSNGTQNQVCTNGKWVSSGTCNDPDVCKNSAAKTEICGYNSNGSESFTCTNGKWESDGCVDPDECTNNTTQTVTGTVSTCTDGKWKTIRKTVQFGTSNGASGQAVTTDSLGNIYITGYTYGALDGNTNAGQADIFLTKFDSSGNAQWTKQFGTTEDDNVYSVAVDSAYNIYITGYTYGSFDENTNAGNADILLIKFNSNGDKLWTKQFGIKNNDYGYSIAIDSNNNIYITGQTYGNLDGNTSTGQEDVFLMKFDTNGNKIWTKQFGSSNIDSSKSLAIDSNNNIYISGYTLGNLDGNTSAGYKDIFLIKIDSNGNKFWTKQFGTSASDEGYAIKIDSNDNIYITGNTSGALDNNTIIGLYDIFLTKFNSSGDKIWTKQFGTINSNYGKSLIIDSSDNIYISGYTNGTFVENINAGSYDLFLTKMSSSGDTIWNKQFGSSKTDYGYSSAIDSSNNIYITGYTSGVIDGNTNEGASDAFLSIIPAE